jgi:ligand-binding sensor domain-containing protein/signal transduction histidine kinase
MPHSFVKNFYPHIVRFFTLAGCLWLTLPVAMAQYRFDSWTTENGLPQASVNSILQTHDGFLWITTFGGLARYDGLRFDVFNSGNTKGLKTSRFMQLLEDRNGGLWAMTEKQGVTRYKNGSFTTFGAESGLQGNLSERMSSDADGNLLINVEGQNRVWKNDAFIAWREDQPADIVAHSADGGYWYYDPPFLKKRENGRDAVVFKTDFKVLRAFEDSKKRLWIAGDKNLLFLLENGRLTSFSTKDNFPDSRFTAAFEDRKGAIWFGTTAGLVRYKNEKFICYTTADGLPSDFVTAINQDREGTMWVGTQKGLSRLTERAVTAYSTENGLASDNVYTVYQDRAGRIWIGSWFGLSVYENGVFQNAGERFGVAKDNVTALAEDREGNFWIGTWGGAVKRIKNGAVENILPEDSGANIRVVFQDAAGNVWIGTSRNLIKFRDGRLTTYTTDDGISGAQIFALAEDRAGNLWIGTDNGLTVIQNGKFLTLNRGENAPANITRSISEDADGALWIGTYDSGLYRYKDNRFTHFTTNEGLFDNGAFQIIEDSAANFWISCNLGIYRVRKSDLNDFADGRVEKVISIPYNKRDGMLDSECNGGASPAGIKAADGKIWFPTQKGVAVIDPKAVPFNPQPPPVAIKSLKIDTKNVSLQSPVQLEPDQTNLEIDYAGLSFINPELVKFKYRLEGLDREWTDASTRRTAFYSHLPPGEYLFRVIAANRDGVWNEQGATVAITVVAPFWRTWWFLTLTALALIGAVVTISRLRERELKRRQLVQQDFSRKLLESQELERKRIATEMHDSLGQYLLAIKNWAMFGLNSLAPDDAAREYLSEVSETSSLAIDEVREIAHNLRPYQLERLGLTSTLEYMMKNLKTPINFSCEIENIDGVLSKDAEIVFYRIVQESINNVVKHSEAQNAQLSVKRDGEHGLEFVCKDDGRGFDFETAKTSPDSGLGLSGIAERVKILDGEYKIDSEPGNGAIVSVKLTHIQ